MTATINNNITQNMSETLPILLRMVDPEEFAKYNSMTPTCLDYLGDYRDGVHEMEFQIDQAGSANSIRAGLYLPGPANTQPVEGQNVAFFASRPQSYLSHANNVLAYDTNRPAGTAYYHKPRGSWKLKELYSKNAQGAKHTPLLTDTDVYAVFEVCEPLLLSPFVFGSGFGKQGFYGIQNMNFQMNILPTGNRAWRSAVFSGAKSVSVVGFLDSQLLFQFLTPHASDMLDPRNVVPYYEMPIFRTTNLPVMYGKADMGQPDERGMFPEAPTVTVNSANIQLSGIPDKLIIFYTEANGDAEMQRH